MCWVISDSGRVCFFSCLWEKSVHKILHFYLRYNFVKKQLIFIIYIFSRCRKSALLSARCAEHVHTYTGNHEKSNVPCLAYGLLIDGIA